MQELQPQPLSREISQSHERLTDEQLDDLLVSFGNHGNKALQIVAMKPDEYYSAYALQSEMENAAAGRRDLVGINTLRIEYCQTFEKFGLVAKTIEEGKYVKYQLTDYGVKVAKPLAGLLLTLGEKYGMDLKVWFGTSHGQGTNRSPAIRRRIMTLLLNSPVGLGPREIAHLTGGDQNVIQNQLYKMGQKGIIEYGAWNPQDNPTTYCLKNRDYELSGKASESLQGALSYMKDNPTAELDEVVAYCYERVSSLNPTAIPYELFRRRLKNSLNGLVRRGALEFAHNKRDTNNRATLTDAQREMWSDVLSQLEEFKQLDSTALAAWSRKASSIFADAPTVLNILTRANQESSLFRSAAAGEIGQLIMSFIDEDGQTARDLAFKVAQIHGRQVTVFAIRNAMKTKVKGAITEKRGGTLYYRKSTDKVLHT
jgi:hypothetical protein